MDEADEIFAEDMIHRCRRNRFLLALGEELITCRVEIFLRARTE